MPVRLQKYMADCGAGARRKCEELIKNGRVSVDGIIITEMGFKIEPGANCVELDGKPLRPSDKLLYIALHKPAGYITASKDQFGRPTVLDLLENVGERVFPVGRLDYDSTGLIFLTNDGEFAYRLTHPKHNITKNYLVTVSGAPSEKALKTLRDGVLLEDGMTLPSQARIVKITEKTSELTITLSEGRNRQVRRMLDAVGNPVLSLKRVAIGGVELGKLKCGKYRYLDNAEVESFLI